MDDNAKDVTEKAIDAVSPSKGWDWQKISLGTFALVCLMLGTYLILQTPNGNETAGATLFVVGAVFAGAWLYDTRDKKEKP